MRPTPCFPCDHMGPSAGGWPWLICTAAGRSNTLRNLLPGAAGRRQMLKRGWHVDMFTWVTSANEGLLLPTSHRKQKHYLITFLNGPGLGMPPIFFISKKLRRNPDWMLLKDIGLMNPKIPRINRMVFFWNMLGSTSSSLLWLWPQGKLEQVDPNTAPKLVCQKPREDMGTATYVYIDL